MDVLIETYSITVLNGLAYGVLLYILALGLTLVFGMMNILNLAHGTVFLLGAYIASRLMTPGRGITAMVAAIAIAAIAGCAFGIMLYALTRSLRTYGHLAEALVTLGVATICGASFLWIFGADYFSAATPAPLTGSLSIMGQVYPLYRFVLILIGVVLAVAVEAVIERTQIGALIRATVVDSDMVQALGVDTARLLALVFGVGGSLAAIGGVLGAPIMGAGPGLDGRVLLTGLVVVVVGGMGSTRGSLIGALLIGQVQTLGTALAPALAPFLVFGAMALVLSVRPTGMLGKPQEAM
jgi:branched-chain amino acid transport system permease protein